MVLTSTSTSTNAVKKATQGRKKIEIKKIEQVSSLQVTFSKRRTGVFKKASELCVLTGAEIAIVVQSPGGRIFAFGHPSVDHIVDNYLTGGTSISSKQILNPKPMNELNQHYAEIYKELEEEKKKKDVIDQSKNQEFWWDEPIDGLALEELQQFVPSLVELKKKVLTRIGELMTAVKSSSLPLFDVNQTPNQEVELGNNEKMHGVWY